MFFHFVEIPIDDEQWNDGLLATIREKVLNQSTLMYSSLLWQETYYLFGAFWVLYEFACLVDQVHMEADRKAMANQANVPADPQFQSRTTYRVKNKVKQVALFSE